MPIVMLASNPLDTSSYTRYDVEHVGEFLLEHFAGAWPETAHIYRNDVARENDVTPCNPGTIEEDIARLDSFEEPLWVVVFPATGVEIAIIIGVVALAASVAAILLIPDIPTIKTPKEKHGLEGSPNNSLGKRDNQARPEQRQPDIFGFNRVIPDMLMVPYIQYENHREVEIGYYCIGRGFFTIDDARDGDMLISQIEHASCHVYNPGDAPTGVGPHTGTADGDSAIGEGILDPVLNVYAIEAVNGQVVEPFTARTIYGAAKKPDADEGYKYDDDPRVYKFFNIMAFEYVDSTHGIIHAPYLKETSYIHDRVSVGDKLFLRWDPANLKTTGAPKPNLVTDPNEPFANAVTVTGVTDAGDYVQIAFTVPAALATEWAKVPAYSATVLSRFGVSMEVPYVEVTSLARLFEGPWFVDFVHPPGSGNPAVMVNFVAPGGLFADDGKTVQKLTVAVTMGVTPCDSGGIPTGPEQYYTDFLAGSDVTDGTRALSFYQILPFSGRFQLRVRRLTRRLRKEELPWFVEEVNYSQAQKKDPQGARGYTGRIQDEIRITQAYSMSEPPNISFGDVTTVHTRTVNTDGATGLHNRRLNLLCHRLIQRWNGTSFDVGLQRDANAENVLFHIMKDSYIGDRPDAEIDFVGIGNAMATVREYFNDSSTGEQATRVAITLDDYNISFEETATLFANIAFCTIYRQGNVIKCRPEIATDDAVVAFNHRNIRPGTQKITHTMGPPTENDSVEVTYHDPIDDSITHVHVPLELNSNPTTVSPKDVRIVGLGSRKQAMWHAYRAYYRMLFQRQAAEMQVTQEGGLVLLRDRVLMADVTVQDKQSGHVVAVSGLNVKLSQTPTFTGIKTYTIFLQHRDGTVEGIPATQLSGFFDILLDSAPSVSLVTDPQLGVPTIYTLVQDDETAPFAYMISEVSAQSNMSFNISAINYSNMYYFGDGLEMYVQGNTTSISDESPSEHPLVSDHAFSITAEPVRGNMLNCDGTNAFNADFTVTTDALDITGGYSIFAWVKHNSTPAFGYSGIAQTTDDTTTLFGFNDNDVAAGHNNVLQVQATPPAPGTLHSMGVTWDPVATRLALFVNGVLVDEAIGVPAPTTPLSYEYLATFNGLAGTILRYKRTFTDRAMMELHLKTKL